MTPGKAPSRTGSAPHPPYPHAQKSRTATTRPARCAPRLGPATCQTRMRGQRERPPSAPPPHSPRLAPALRSVARVRGHAAAPRPSASARITGVFGRRLSLEAGAQRAGRVVACISADKGACGPGGVVPRLSVRTTLCRGPWGYAPRVGAPGDVFASPAVGTPVTQGTYRPQRSAAITQGQRPALRARRLTSGSPA